MDKRDRIGKNPTGPADAKALSPAPPAHCATTDPHGKENPYSADYGRYRPLPPVGEQVASDYARMNVAPPPPDPHAMLRRPSQVTDYNVAQDRSRNYKGSTKRPV